MSDLDSPRSTDLDRALEGDAPVDGRVARRERNINAVLDVVLEMFGEEALFPTMEQAATRSGLSLRSLYRYFADPGELLEATIQRSRERAQAVAQIPAIGQGEFADRIDDFVAARLRLHELSGPGFRATLANAARLPRIRDEVTRTRNELREQISLQFAPELSSRKPAEREAVLSACDLLTQLDSIDFLRRHRQLSLAKTKAVLTTSLTSLLS